MPNFNFENIMQKGTELAQKAAQGATTLVNMGKDKASAFALEQKLEVLQRKLGALIYTMSKSGKPNGELVQKYIDQIDEVEMQILELRREISDNTDILVCENCGAIIKPEEAYCRICGEKVI